MKQKQIKLSGKEGFEKYYQDLFSKVDKAIFIQKQKI